MRRISCYDHLNKDDKFSLKIDLEEIARKMVGMNYGTHRFLSALVRIRRADPEINEDPVCKMLTDGIEELLNKGGY